MFVVREYQERALKGLNAAESQGALIMPPGAGKTSTVTYWISTLREDDRRFPIVVVVHQCELLGQWIADFAQFFSRSEICAIGSADTVPPNLAWAFPKRGIKRQAQIFIVMERSASALVERFDIAGITPGCIVYDEGHLLAARECRRVLRVAYPDTLEIALTGSPVNHKASPVQFADVFPRGGWITPVTNSELIEGGFWAKQDYLSIPDEYKDIAEREFKNLVIEDGKPLSNSGRAVMARMWPEQLKIIRQYSARRDTEGTMFFCCDVKHATMVAKSLKEEGIFEKIEVVTGKTKDRDRARILEKFRAGEIEAVAVVGCWLCGVDIKNAGTGWFLSPVESLPLWLQMLTRLSRAKVGECEGLTMRVGDLAMNLATHGLLADTAFIPGVRDHSDRGYRNDPRALMCENPECLHIHGGFPKPFKESEEGRLTPKMLTGLYEDDSEIADDDPIACERCGQVMAIDVSTAIRYIDARSEFSRSRPSEVPDCGMRLKPCEGLEVPATFGLLTKLGWYLTPAEVRREREADIAAQEARSIDRAAIWREKCKAVELLYKRAERAAIVKSFRSDFPLKAVLNKVSEIGDYKASSFETLEKATKCLIVSAFVERRDPLDAYRPIEHYDMTDVWIYAIEGQQGGYEPGTCSTIPDRSIAIGPDDEPPIGELTNVSIETKRRVFFAQCFNRAMEWLYRGTDGAGIDMIESWATGSYSAHLSQATRDRIMNQDATKSARNADLMRTVLDVVAEWQMDDV